MTPVVDRRPALSGAPSTAAVESRLDAIRDLTSNGRLAKAKNLWDPEWEAGVTSFIDGYRKLSALRSELGDYFYRCEQLLRDEDTKSELQSLRETVQQQATALAAASTRSSRLTILGILATVATTALAIAVSILLYKIS